MNIVTTVSSLSFLAVLAAIGLLWALCQTRARLKTERLKHASDIQIERLENQLARDSVTSAHSRAYFLNRLADGQRNQPVVLVMLDVDQFKSVNDSFGHDTGDTLLQGIALECWGLCRGHDFVARIGGDEFCLVLFDTELPTAMGIAEQLRHSLETRALIASRPGLHRTISLGLAQLAPDDKLGTALSEADIALYAAKDSGRNRAVPIDESLRTAWMRLRAEPTLEDVREGLARNEFTYFVQPIFDLTTGHPSGVEALIRWVQPDGTIRLPKDFLHLFTRRFSGSLRPPTGLANSMAATLTESNASLYCAFNISTSFLTRSFQPTRAWLDELLMGINPRQAVFEIVESSPIDNVETTRTMLTFLRSQGVRIALDDFGTGYSNLNRLCDLPVDIVKIDKSLIQNLHTDPHQQAILRALMGLSREMGFQVIAEGVETADELRAIIDLGVTQAQGFFLGRPQALQEWMSERPYCLPALRQVRPVALTK